MERNLDIGLDMSRLKNHVDYKDVWKSLAGIEIRMVEKHERCTHNVGDCFYYSDPYTKPDGVCNALLHVLDLYSWRVVLGFPSWNPDDRCIHRIHCPDPKGTVWEMRKVCRRGE